MPHRCAVNLNGESVPARVLMTDHRKTTCDPLPKRTDCRRRPLLFQLSENDLRTLSRPSKGNRHREVILASLDCCLNFVCFHPEGVLFFTLPSMYFDLVGYREQSK